MENARPRRLSSQSLRIEVGTRNLARGAALAHEVTFGRVPSVLYAADDEGGHGNFLRASYRRIVADPLWAARLKKSYTGVARVPRAGDRWRGELECSGSSDALLMNVFCFPGVLRKKPVCAHMGVDPGLRPSFGVRADLPMRNGEVDRTELDMALGDLLVEAKLTEGGFGRASRERLLRYLDVAQVFDLEELPQTGGQFTGYQIIRGVMAALEGESRYLVLLDARRFDLQEICFRVLRAARVAEASSRFRLLTWQELAHGLPRSLQAFLTERYGIEPL